MAKRRRCWRSKPGEKAQKKKRNGPAQLFLQDLSHAGLGPISLLVQGGLWGAPTSLFLSGLVKTTKTKRVSDLLMARAPTPACISAHCEKKNPPRPPRDGPRCVGTVYKLPHPRLAKDAAQSPGTGHGHPLRLRCSCRALQLSDRKFVALKKPQTLNLFLFFNYSGASRCKCRRENDVLLSVSVWCCRERCLIN